MEPSADKQLIVILGMHRSGTSVIARSLKVLGVDLGNNLLPPGPDNPRGYWEDLDVNLLNIELLRSLGHDWHTLIPPSISNELLSLVADKYKSQAVELLHSKLETTTIFGLKDPRLPRLLPFWKDIFDQLGVRVSYVIACRNPLSVAHSLAERDGFDFWKGYYLWLEHLYFSLSQTSSENRIVVDYDRLMDNAPNELQRISKFLRMPVSFDSNEFIEFKSNFLDSSLRHNKFEMSDLYAEKNILLGVISLYKLLTKLASDNLPASAEEVELTLEKIGEYLKVDYSVANYMQSYAEKVTILLNKLNDCDKKLQEFNRDLASHGGKYKEVNLEITALSESVTKVDDLVTDLNQLAIGRADKVGELEQIVTDRDKEIARLNEDLKDKMSKINNLFQLVAKHEKSTQLIDAIRNSHSWRITLPFRFLARLMRYGVIDSDREVIIQKLKMIYQRLPLSSSIKDRLKRIYNKHYRSQTAKGNANVVINAQSAETLLRPADQNDNMPDYIIWGVIDWHFRQQRPQNLARALAASGRRVFYVSSALIDSEEHGFACEAIAAPISSGSSGPAV